VEDALNSLKDSVPTSNVVPDVSTSFAQEKPTSDAVGDEDYNVTNVNAGSDDFQIQGDIENEGEENVVGTPANENTDKRMSVEDDVVDLDVIDDLDQTVNEVASGSIAKRLRNRKGEDVDVVTNTTKPIKKKMVGPNRRPSKVEVPTKKQKKSLKRKQASVGDSDYDVEEEVPNIVSSPKKKTRKKK
jgi:hypothetical protein